MDQKQIGIVITILGIEVKNWKIPIVTEVSQKANSPFQILISCILSLRTQDKTTAEATGRLFALATTPDSLSKLHVQKIEKTIYPVGFYRNKARQIKAISKSLVEKYDSVVPNEIDELLKFKGVGRKTANLVVTLGYGKPGICVDTHVHRITNRWGYVNTRNPEETEFALRKKLPKKYWLIINDLLVTFGQNHCKPISPYCSTCKISNYCDRVDVIKNR